MTYAVYDVLTREQVAGPFRELIDATMACVARGGQAAGYAVGKIGEPSEPVSGDLPIDPDEGPGLFD